MAGCEEALGCTLYSAGFYPGELVKQCTALCVGRLRLIPCRLVLRCHCVRLKHSPVQPFLCLLSQEPCCSCFYALSRSACVRIDIGCQTVMKAATSRCKAWLWDLLAMTFSHCKQGQYCHRRCFTLACNIAALVRDRNNVSSCKAAWKSASFCLAASPACCACNVECSPHHWQQCKKLSRLCSSGLYMNHLAMRKTCWAGKMPQS